jgi:uncharacterized protein YndB with AHSA1/START domain
MQSRAMPGTGFSGVIEAEVLAFEQERMLQVRWRDADPDSPSGADWSITWTLTPGGRGTRLFLVHDGFDPDNPLEQRARSVMDGGWRTITAERLGGVLESAGV